MGSRSGSHDHLENLGRCTSLEASSLLILGLVRGDGIQDSLLRGVRRACFLLRVDVGAGSSIWLCLVGIFM